MTSPLAFAPGVAELFFMRSRIWTFLAVVTLGVLGFVPLPHHEAHAGVFNIPHFVMPGDFAIGVEPELVLTNGAGAGLNVKYTHGLNDLMNLQGIIGTGGGPRRFRVGANATFDFFPDIEKQPGIGISGQAMYYRLRKENVGDETAGRLELTAIPYIHKTFLVGPQKNEVEPYFAVPFGMGFSEGKYTGLVSVAVGSMFKNTEKLRYVTEIGVAVNHTESYVSVGVVYYH